MFMAEIKKKILLIYIRYFAITRIRLEIAYLETVSWCTPYQQTKGVPLFAPHGYHLSAKFEMQHASIPQNWSM